MLPYFYVLANESPLRYSDQDECTSIQARETDYVKDTSDTDWCDTESCDTRLEYEPASDTHEELLSHSDESEEEEIIRTQVISVSTVGAGGEEADADSEGSTAGGESDPELGPHDYWRCAQCRNANNNPLYRYCYKCFQVRKNLFPPRPKRRTRALVKPQQNVESSEAPRVCHLARFSSLTSHIDSGFDSAYNSQELTPTQESLPSLRELCTSLIRYNSDSTDSLESRRRKRAHERRASLDSEPATKRHESSGERCVSEEECTAVEIPTRAVVNCLRREMEEASAGDEGVSLCVVCCTEPKSAVFVHTNVAHICCCYRCAVRVWASTRRCPVCNRPVRNVLKAIM